MAFTCSLVGLIGAALLGQKLVGLEISNQKVEALLRKDLVLLETTPAVIVGTRPSSDDRYAAFLPQTYFRNTLESLHKNYFALFKHFGVLNFWLSLFDQVMVLAPYAIAAPLVFAARPRQPHHPRHAHQDEQQLREGLREPERHRRELGRHQRLPQHLPPPPRV